MKAFIRIAQDYGLDFGLLREVDRINQERPIRFVEKVKRVLWSVKDKKLAVWGLAFKPNTDDIREAPSIKIVDMLLREGAKLSLYDPKAMQNFKLLFPEGKDISYAKDPYSAVEGAEALLILTEWEEFKKADLERVKSLMALPIIVDGRNVYESSEVRALGFEYYPVGR